MDHGCTRSTLQRVAFVLGVSESAFLPSDIRRADGAPEAFQTLELLELFAAIADPEARLSCLAYVRARGATVADQPADDRFSL